MKITSIIIVDDVNRIELKFDTGLLFFESKEIYLRTLNGVNVN